jgi:hypothetical protein
MRVRNKNGFVRNLRARHTMKTRALATRRLNNALVDLRRNTPVDTGRARDGWTIEGATLDFFIVDRIIEKNIRSSVQAISEASEIKFKINNEQEYIAHVNNGTSEIAPRRFIEQTLARYGKILGPLAKLKK